MPKIIKSFTIHLENKHTSYQEMYEYLTTNFGPDWDDAHENIFWYIGRNYKRPFTESHLEITFYTEPNSKHTMMYFYHPFKIIAQDAEKWLEVSNYTFDKLFEVE